MLAPFKIVQISEVKDLKSKTYQKNDWMVPDGQPILKTGPSKMKFHQQRNLKKKSCE